MHVSLFGLYDIINKLAYIKLRHYSVRTEYSMYDTRYQLFETAARTNYNAPSDINSSSVTIAKSPPELQFWQQDSLVVQCSRIRLI